MRAGRRRVRISSADKLLFPADGITKAALASYYARIAPVMAPHVRDRPLNLWRWNKGIDNDVVVQQEIPRGAPDWVRRVRVARRRGGSVCHAVGGEAATLLWLANLNCITPHAWTSRAGRPDQPDRLVFDLDPPGEDAGSHFPAIRDGARALGALLAELGLAGFAMTSARAGCTSWRRCAGAPTQTRRARSRARSPRRSRHGCRTCSRRPGGRRSAAAACSSTSPATPTPRRRSPRTRCGRCPGAPVATPLAWDELDDPDLHPRRWTLASVPARVAERGDPWARIGASARALPRG
jgi:bifunctional non-homologous end joining protein LigD